MSKHAVALQPPLDLLRQAMPDLPPRLREVGRFLSGHEFDAATRSMRGLAAAAGVNPASFTRLAQALGYRGWDELRDALIEARRPGTDAPFSGRLRAATGEPAQDSAAIATALIGSDTAGLSRVATAPIAAAAAALHAAPRAWIAGFRSCRAVAELLHYQLRLFRPDVVHLVGSAGPEDLDFGAFRAGHAVVVVGFAPYSRASVMTVRAARTAGCRIIAIADTPQAPMAEGADHLLLFEAASSPGFFPSLTGAVAQAQALAAGSFVLGGKGALLRLRQTEARLAAHSQYVPGPESIEP
ncbi:MurR/RpiR family transcriptional regulator [Acidisoma cladoniae]|jgi:DNA-binding MurR/RpiR family transcriptional regulator|uniref:MurR/RpiR family transcriptional regulator n=1 Tax=Acidisoma cladoniae TaxID=3040935 RepID=UPI00254E11F8|nr:MurR/RpiR family transcriptional regulator [Acidisoma sp. PAMC 29798]